jgi:anti-anti-sigma factor
MDFGVEIERGESAVVLRLRGEFDFLAVQLVRERFSGLVEDGVVDVVVELSEIHFLDASAIRLLVGLRHAARERGRRLKVERPSPAVARVLRVAGALDLLGDDGRPNGNGAARSA